MRIVIHLSIVLFLCYTAVAICGDAKEDAKAMEGDWLAASAELAGTKFPDEIRQAVKLNVKEGAYTVNIGGKVDKGAIKLDATKNPKTMDLIGTDGPNQGKTFLAIYEITKDGMKICYDLTGKERPKEFKTEKGATHFLVVYQREKK